MGLERGAFLVVAVLLLHPKACAAGWPVIPAFYQLAAGSDLVVLGRIVALEDSTFTLAVEEVLVGASSDSLVQAVRHQEISVQSGYRSLPYAIGQREIAFLCDCGPYYRTNRAEGEWLITGNLVTTPYVGHQRALRWVKGLDQVLDLDVVVSALKDFGACVRIDYEWFPSEEGKPIGSIWRCREIVVKMCDSKTLGHLAARSRVHRFLFETSSIAAQEKTFAPPVPCARCQMALYQPW
jgi:hypothetical protein